MLLLNVLLIVCAATAQLSDKPYYDLEDAHNLFKVYVQEHGRLYDTEEYLTRLEIFKESLKEINERNAKHPITKYGITDFVDLTAEERQKYTGQRLGDKFEDLKSTVEYPPEAITAPDHWDWRDHGVVVPQVPNADIRKCNSAYAFSATATIEGQYAMKYNKCLSLSAQQGLDCADALEHFGKCEAGLSYVVMKHYMPYGRFKRYITLEKEYPYKGKEGPCLEKLDLTPITNVTAIKMISTDEESLKQVLYKYGPLSTLLINSDLFLYDGGILIPDTCKSGFMWSFVLLVGYGTENGTNYWICKNFWGPKWGEKGYFRIQRGVKACYLGIETYTCTVS